MTMAGGEEQGERAPSARDDLAVFRWLEKQISNKKAITACLHVQRGISYSEEPPVLDQVAET